MDEYTLYYASNEMPPDWFLNPTDKVWHCNNIKAKLRELQEWETIMFCYEHNTHTFEPLNEEDVGKDIKDFKYLIKSTS